jgi:hypothetical protein
MKTHATGRKIIMAAALAGGMMLIPATVMAQPGAGHGRGGYDRGGAQHAPAGRQAHDRDRDQDSDRSGFRIGISIGNRGGYGSGLGHQRPAPPPVSHAYRHWVPGHYATYSEQVLVHQGHYDKVWHEPVYELRRHGNHHDRVLVHPGHWDQVWHEPVYETRVVRKWVPGRWEVGHGHH